MLKGEFTLMPLGLGDTQPPEGFESDFGLLAMLTIFPHIYEGKCP